MFERGRDSALLLFLKIYLRKHDLFDSERVSKSYCSFTNLDWRRDFFERGRDSALLLFLKICLRKHDLFDSDRVNKCYCDLTNLDLEKRFV